MDLSEPVVFQPAYPPIYDFSTIGINFFINANLVFVSLGEL